MGTKRNRRTVARTGITPEALTAWQQGDYHLLNKALGIPPWQPSPFDVRRPEPPDYAVGMLYGDAWPRIWARREVPLDMGGPPGRVGRHGEPRGARKGKAG
jgi:hypothetical protein